MWPEDHWNKPCYKYGALTELDTWYCDYSADLVGQLLVQFLIETLL